MERVQVPETGQPMPSIRPAGPARIVHWLTAGTHDLFRAPVPALFFGIVFAAIGFLAFSAFSGMPHLVTAMISGFLLIAPFLAVGLYRISQRLERGERPTLTDALTAWRVNYGSIGLFAAFLGFAFIAWERISAVLFALMHGRNPPAVADPSAWLQILAADPVFLALYLLLGALAAAGVYALAVVSIPLMMDRPVDPVTALITSVGAVRTSPVTLSLWAAVIVALFGIGLLTRCIALVVIMPVLGHASWHAFRDLVAPGEPSR